MSMQETGSGPAEASKGLFARAWDGFKAGMTPEDLKIGSGIFAGAAVVALFRGPAEFFAIMGSVAYVLNMAGRIVGAHRDHEKSLAEEAGKKDKPASRTPAP